MDCILPFIEIIKYIGTPTSKYVRSHRKLEKNMQILKDSLQDLNSKRTDLEKQLVVELSLLRKIEKQEVKNWMERVKKINKEVESIETQVNKHKCISRARLGKQVEEMIPEVQNILKKAETFYGSLVIDRPPATGVRLPVEKLVGQRSAVDKIWEHLMNDEIRKIGVCGEEGIGKTVIMKHVNNKLLEDQESNKFKKVIWVTFSGEFKLQKDIAAELGFNGQELPEENTLKRAATLMEMLEAKKGHLIIFDDVHKEFSLVDVGIPEPSAQNGSKIVLVSRSQEICRRMHCQVVEAINPLSEDDALKLFVEKGGHEHFMGMPTIAPVVKGVAKECGGLPLAIITTANSMNAKNDGRDWRKKLREMRPTQQSRQNEDDDVIKAIMSKYDTNHDGVLDKKELVRVFRDMGSKTPAWRAQKALRHADSNRDGYIAEEELDNLVQYMLKRGYRYQ